MIAALARFIDWFGLQALSLRMARLDGENPRVEEAIRFVNGPDFIPRESQPARLEFVPEKQGLHFRFPSPRPSGFAENDVVPGRLYRCAGRWQDRPTIILLHGAGDFVNHRFRFPWIARHCNRLGFNAATLVLPYHFQRRPRRSEPLNRPDYLRAAETTAQAVAEIRAMAGWLLAEGCPSVALWGISYGGWLSGLTVCNDSRLGAAVLTVPPVRLHRTAAEVILRPGIREDWRAQRPALDVLNRTRLNLTHSRPAIPKGNILLIECLHDLFVAKDPIEELWQAWDQPEIWRLPHGHLSFMAKPGLTARVLRWLAARTTNQTQ
ncbi:MAG TPA: alpha/beta hydrolase family protein [Verrucomicrobiae bacterium]|nr:alpha/beta hydrolase family protein [Verrucomicrobiae bacterium]